MRFTRHTVDRPDPLRKLCPRISSDRLLVIVAHPDDEVIGAGAHFRLWPRATFVHVTDGAPRNMSDALRAGIRTREQYAAVRRKELQQALTLAGIPAAHLLALGIGDQESSYRLDFLTWSVLELLLELRPVAVLTQPYEGGHPDHDSTAFALHTACRWLQTRQKRAPEILELTSYHNSAGSMQTSQFLAAGGDPELSVVLDQEQRKLKMRMLACFATQQHVLKWFPVDLERFRKAPNYDFSAPPHGGKLYYELFDWGMTGLRWRDLAAGAARKVGVALAPNEHAAA